MTLRVDVHCEVCGVQATVTADPRDGAWQLQRLIQDTTENHKDCKRRTPRPGQEEKRRV